VDRPLAAVVVPAHNERAVIPRLLRGLDTGRLDVVVVCNGCTDDTAAVAAGFPGVRVLETPVPSKAAALRLGDGEAGAFPRVYVDADVELGTADVERLVRALDAPGVLAAAPERVIPRDGVSLPVRWYYDVWEQLPGVRAGIFGRGVVALSAEGHARVSALPALMSDDLAMSAVFADGERRVVPDARVVVRPPRVWSDLVRRRIRAATGTAQAYEGDHGGEWATDSRTTKADLVGIVRRRPAMLFRMPVFLAVTVLARRGAARAKAKGDYTSWLRDESSRQQV
jgi:cellulose synthase/poly-beta-1,6-N-acetylglucosamine synthase-like glycosyltransferase